MLSISMRPDRVRLGQGCEIHTLATQPDVQIRYYVSQRSVLYTKPLSDWIEPGTFNFFPEAPGHYTLMIQWRESNGATGWQPYDFAVEADQIVNDGPRKVRIDAETEVWVASRWEAKLLSGYERPVVDFMRRTIGRGWAVYDIGANIGLYSILFARMVGPQGYTYCIEANPLCIYLLRTNLELNKISNYQILPVAALDETGSVNFTINYGNLGLGVTQRSSFYTSKIGHEVGIYGTDMDTLVQTYGLRPPQLIKIDVEGAEGFVLAGLDNVIKAHHPYLMVEVHGRSAAEQTFQRLSQYSYRYEILNNGLRFSDSDEILQWYPESVLQVGCLPNK